MTTYLLARAGDRGGTAAGRARSTRPCIRSRSRARRPTTRVKSRACRAARLLLDAGDNAVYCATAGEMPHLLEEIGRLREPTFRAVGEGTGRARDLDSFDEYYEHLFIWNRKREEVVGAYRVGRVDEIRKGPDARGLYTASLFHYREPFFQLLGPALELGRSFVRPKQQRSFAPLLSAVEGNRRLPGARAAVPALAGSGEHQQ